MEDSFTQKEEANVFLAMFRLNVDKSKGSYYEEKTNHSTQR